MWHEDDLFFAFVDPVKRDTFEKTEDESVFIFSLRLLFFFKPYCFVLRWRFRSPFNVSLEMNTSGFAGNILCVHLDFGAGVSILAILVYNRGWFCTLILNILMKCKKRTNQHDTSKSIYILNQLDIEFLVRALTVLRKRATHPSSMFLRVPPDLDTELLLKLHDICTFVW